MSNAAPDASTPRQPRRRTLTRFVASAAIAIAVVALASCSAFDGTENSSADPIETQSSAVDGQAGSSEGQVDGAVTPDGSPDETADTSADTTADNPAEVRGAVASDPDGEFASSQMAEVIAECAADVAAACGQLGGRLADVNTLSEDDRITAFCSAGPLLAEEGDGRMVGAIVLSVLFGDESPMAAPLETIRISAPGDDQVVTAVATATAGAAEACANTQDELAG